MRVRHEDSLQEDPDSIWNRRRIPCFALDDILVDLLRVVREKRSFSRQDLDHENAK